MNEITSKDLKGYFWKALAVELLISVFFINKAVSGAGNVKNGWNQPNLEVITNYLKGDPSKMSWNIRKIENFLRAYMHYIYACIHALHNFGIQDKNIKQTKNKK